MSIPWGNPNVPGQPVMRKLLPDDRWTVGACGFVKTTVALTLSLVYIANDTSMTTLATLNQPITATYLKTYVGPAAGRGPLAPTVPQNEAIPTFGLVATFSGGTVDLYAWTFWLQMTPRNV